MKEIAIKYWLEFGFALMTAFGAWIWNKFRQTSKEQEAIKDSLKSLLSDKIKDKYYKSAYEKCCPLYRLEDTLELYEPYKKLGGNGTIESIVNEMSEMPHKEKDNESK